MPRVTQIITLTLLFISPFALYSDDMEKALLVPTPLEPVEAAEAYSSLHEQLVNFARALGQGSGNPKRFYTLIEKPETSLTPQERNKLHTFAKSFFAELNELTQTPIAKWGKIESYHKPDPTPSFLLVSWVQDMNSFARWYAKDTLEDAPQDALDAVFAAARAGRHINSEPTLTTFLVKIASDHMALDTLAQLAPEMSEVRLMAINIFWDTLPDTGTLQGALVFERDYFLAWVERALERESLRIKAKKNYLFAPREPLNWEALIHVFGKEFMFIDPDLDQALAQAKLEALGITPRTALKLIRDAREDYTQLLTRLDQPYSQIKKWADEVSEKPNIFSSAIAEHVKDNREHALKENAFILGLSYLQGSVPMPDSSTTVSYIGHPYAFEKMPRGFRLKAEGASDASAITFGE